MKFIYGFFFNEKKKVYDSYSQNPKLNEHRATNYTLVTMGKHKVFISFRGEDTRNTFTSHLQKAFKLKHIKTFMDDKNLRRGEEISGSLLRAIKKSKLSIIIFSPNYASSKWCLDELVKILECKKKRRQVVVPIFYNVSPSSVRNQKGSFGSALDEHAKRERKERVKKWKAALKEAASLSGWDSQDIWPESQLVENIVEDVSNKLDQVCSVAALCGLAIALATLGASLF
ncbi:hypothetical protein Tsubulata_001461 [Turnera subulata]|uniref:TIR domain-containing protein n=1 Tax=Turnera subulata TaxID=218843 RepID=A0A9Q0J5T1_9ROSI|nr:hypothetical protein Tsubulata_001461 [Turnera subulata]